MSPLQFLFKNAVDTAALRSILWDLHSILKIASHCHKSCQQPNAFHGVWVYHTLHCSCDVPQCISSKIVLKPWCKGLLSVPSCYDWGAEWWDTMFLPGGNWWIPLQISVERAFRVVLVSCELGFTLHGLEVMRLYQLLVTVYVWQMTSKIFKMVW